LHAKFPRRAASLRTSPPKSNFTPVSCALLSRSICSALDFFASFLPSFLPSFLIPSFLPFLNFAYLAAFRRVAVVSTLLHGSAKIPAFCFRKNLRIVADVLHFPLLCSAKFKNFHA